MANTKKYIELPLDDRLVLEKAFGGRLPADAEVSDDGCYLFMGMSLNSPTAKEEDFAEMITESDN